MTKEAREQEIRRLKTELLRAEHESEQAIARVCRLQDELIHLEKEVPAFAALQSLQDRIVVAPATFTFEASSPDRFDESVYGWSAAVSRYRYAKRDGTLIAELVVTERTPK